jgi:hypothetical protein
MADSNDIKVLLVGGLGNIGRRYHAILKNMGAKVCVYDIYDTYSNKPHEYDKFPLVHFYDITHIIIASPTNTHIEYLKEYLGHNIPVLCEKPMGGDMESLLKLSKHPNIDKVKMVCNWLFLDPVEMKNPGLNTIKYDYFNTGKESIEFNMAQAVYLDNNCSVKTDSATFKLSINDIKISLYEMEMSYIWMLYKFIYYKNTILFQHTRNGEFFSKSIDLWNIEDAIKMCEKIKLWKENYYG